MKRVLAIVFVCFMLSGCATGSIKNFYTDNTGGIDISKDPRWIITSKPPELYIGNNPEEDAIKMQGEGYTLIGSCHFSAGPDPSIKNQALAQAKELHASVIIIYSKYTNTISGAMPLTLPNVQTSTTNASGMVGNSFFTGSANTSTYGTQTTYVPYNIDRYDYLIVYLAQKKFRLGVFFDDLTSEEKRQIESNKGVVIKRIMKNSPAFEADLLDGDIIKKFNDIEVIDKEHFNKLLEGHGDETITLSLIRAGRQITKTIKLNP